MQREFAGRYPSIVEEIEVLEPVLGEELELLIAGLEAGVGLGLGGDQQQQLPQLPPGITRIADPGLIVGTSHSNNSNTNTQYHYTRSRLMSVSGWNCIGGGDSSTNTTNTSGIPVTPGPNQWKPLSL